MKILYTVKDGRRKYLQTRIITDVNMEEDDSYTVSGKYILTFHTADISDCIVLPVATLKEGKSLVRELYDTDKLDISDRDIFIEESPDASFMDYLMRDMLDSDDYYYEDEDDFDDDEDDIFDFEGGYDGGVLQFPDPDQ